MNRTMHSYATLVADTRGIGSLLMRSVRFSPMGRFIPFHFYEDEAGLVIYDVWVDYVDPTTSFIKGYLEQYGPILVVDPLGSYEELLLAHNLPSIQLCVNKVPNIQNALLLYTNCMHELAFEYFLAIKKPDFSGENYSLTANYLASNESTESFVTHLMPLFRAWGLNGFPSKMSLRKDESLLSRGVPNQYIDDFSNINFAISSTKSQDETLLKFFAEAKAFFERSFIFKPMRSFSFSREDEKYIYWVNNAIPTVQFTIKYLEEVKRSTLTFSSVILGSEPAISTLMEYALPFMHQNIDESLKLEKESLGINYSGFDLYSYWLQIAKKYEKEKKGKK